MDDCLVIGAGVIGLSIAYELAQVGIRVRVIDRGQPGHEASWAGAGILPPANLETAEHPFDQLRAISNQIHEQWAARLLDETGVENGYRRCGGLYVARSVGEVGSLVGLAEALTSQGISVQTLKSRELAELEPALQPLVESRGILSSLLLPDEAQLRNPRHVRALVAACRNRDVEIEPNVAITEIVLGKTGIEKITTSAGDRRAVRYCFSVGAWTYELLRQIGVTTGILPVRGQMVLFACNSPPFRRVLNEGSRYLVPRDDGHVLAGSTEEEVGFDKSTTESAIADLRQFACDLIPALRLAKVERSWAGLRPASFDGFPYIGAVPGLANAFVAAGHFRSGLQLSTGTARVIGQLIRGERPEIDLTPFQVGRG